MDKRDLNIDPAEQLDESLRRVVLVPTSMDQLRQIREKLINQIAYYRISSDDVTAHGYNLASLQGQLFILDHLLLSKNILQSGD